MPRYRMTIAYDGTDFCGWQVQPRGHTIQGHLESCLSAMAKRRVKVTGSGRTDSGVHALAQVAHFELDQPIPLRGICRGLNAMLPGDIRVMQVREVEPDFHARYSARSKTYRYCLDRSAVPLPFRRRFALHYPHRLDRHALDRAAAALEGEHDFRAFRAAACRAKTTVRHCSASRWLELDSELVYEVSATGFLHHMVRNFVGTLLEIGRGKRPWENISDLLAAGDRTLAGPTAPAKGLHLHAVHYDLSESS